jgi:PAS domain-containing protein|nr:PAS domain-containing protein [Trichormus azollae]
MIDEQSGVSVISKVETALENQENYQQLVELFPEVILIETEGNVVFVHSAAVNLFGAKKATGLLGKPLLDFVAPNS